MREYLEAGELDGFVRTIRKAEPEDRRVPVFVFHAGRRLDGGLRAAAQAAARGHADVRPRAGRGLHRGAGRAVRAEAAGAQRRRARSSWPAGRWAGRWPTPARSGSSRQGADVRFVGLIDTVRAGEEVPQTKEETRDALGPLREVRRRRPSTSRSRRSRTRSSRTSTTRVRCSSCSTRCKDAACRSPAASSSTSGRRTWTTARWTPSRSSRTTGTSRCTWPTATTTTRSSSSPRYAIRKPDGGWGEFVVGSGGGADRGRAHPGHRRAVHCEGRRAHERGDQPHRGGERAEVTRGPKPSTQQAAHHRREAGRTPREAGAGQGPRRREGQGPARQEGHPERPRAHPRAARPGQLPRDRRAGQDAGRSERVLRRRRGHRPRHHRRPPGRRVQPRPDGVPGFGRRDVRPQGRQADGVGGHGRLPDHRHQRLRRRPHPGRRDVAGLVRRARPPPRAAARPGARRSR